MFNAHPLVVNRNSNWVDVKCFKEAERPVVGGILNNNIIPVFKKSLGNEADRLLRAGCNKNVIGVDHYSVTCHYLADSFS